MGAPLRRVLYPRRQSLRVQAQAKNIHRRLQQPGLDASEQQPDGRIGRHQGPMTVDGESRIRRMPCQHQLNGLASLLQGWVIQASF